MANEFRVPTRVLAEIGGLAALDDVLGGFDRSRLFVVADRGIVTAGLLEKVLRHSPHADSAPRALVDVDSGVATVEECASAALAADARLVLGIGGGNALGVAKAVAIRLTNTGRIDEYRGVDRVPADPAPVVAIPTTAGSGSEVSPVLVLHEPGLTEELVVRSWNCAPRVAILDGTVLRGLPREPMLYAALDALSHCLEATWVAGRSSFATSLSLRAAEAILAALPPALDGIESGANRAGTNDEILQRLIEASCAANMACGNTGLALVHALSTAPSLRLPHGYQNGVLLPHVAMFNESVSVPEVRRIERRLPGFYRRIGFDARFIAGEVGPLEAEAMRVASTDHPFRMNNLVASSDDDVLSILAAAGAVVQLPGRV